MDEKGQAKVLLSDLKVLSLQAKWSVNNYVDQIYQI